MNFVFFTHSLASDWNHGNAHFLRGIMSELLARGHEAVNYEQTDNWSRWQLERDHGPAASAAFAEIYPQLRTRAREYELTQHDLPADQVDLDRIATEAKLDEVLRDADVVLVHEWSPHRLVKAIGEHRKHHDHYRLLFHDTHHRIVSKPQEMEAYDLSGYDGVLAFGDVLRQAYAARGWGERVWTWHEAADTRVFRPLEREKEGDLVWVGNWGDDERTAELHEFLLGPSKALGLKAKVHGVRYPEDAKAALAEAGIEYGQYLPNFRAPELFARYRVTVHVPRRYYVTHLPGIPTIRPFEALACGIPLVCSPWQDAEGLFSPGEDYLIARDGAEMRRHLNHLLTHSDAAAAQADRGLATIRTRHTCGHRVDELLAILETLA